MDPDDFHLSGKAPGGEHSQGPVPGDGNQCPLRDSSVLLAVGGRSAASHSRIHGTLDDVLRTADVVLGLPGELCDRYDILRTRRREIISTIIPITKR